MQLGIPRTLLYYPYFPFWQRFFAELGLPLHVSPQMTPGRFDTGARRFVGDMCLPVESAFYHVEALRGRVDAVFLPRFTDPRRDIYVCPVYAGLPAMLSNAFPEGPDLLSLGLSPVRPLGRRDLRAMGRLGCRPGAVSRAWAAAVGEHKILRARGRDGAAADAAPEAGAGWNILLLGMPYVLEDPFVNAGVPRMLEAMGCRITRPYPLVPELEEVRVTVEDYPVHWTFGAMSVGALAKAPERGNLDGVVYCSSFACGVDSLITPIIQSTCRRCRQLPYLQLVLDEHADQAHLEVRLEAFLDCIHRTGAARRVRNG